MAYIAGYDSDVFVSYAHVDDVPFPGQQTGWVCTLIDALQTLLAQQLGRAEIFKVWRDQNLPGNAPVTPEIMGAVERSATMVVVMSEGYLQSQWCNAEQTKFFDTVGAGTRRWFLVDRMPLDRHRKPEVLRDLGGYPFWKSDRPGAVPRTLGYPTVLPGDRDYYDQLMRLAVELANELKRMRAEKGVPT